MTLALLSEADWDESVRRGRPQPESVLEIRPFPMRFEGGWASGRSLSQLGLRSNTRLCEYGLWVSSRGIDTDCSRRATLGRS